MYISVSLYTVFFTVNQETTIVKINCIDEIYVICVKSNLFYSKLTVSNIRKIIVANCCVVNSNAEPEPNSFSGGVALAVSVKHYGAGSETAPCCSL
jgi:hypothetical protein